MLRDLGLDEVEMDAEGNVMGVRPGTGGGPMLAVLAHGDSVFPDGTDVTVRREGTRLIAPGVGDNARGLALLLTLVRAMDAARLQTAGDILFVGTVGEEGNGDLRGVRYLLDHGRYRTRIARLIAVDGGGAGAVRRRSHERICPCRRQPPAPYAFTACFAPRPNVSIGPSSIRTPS